MEEMEEDEDDDDRPRYSVPEPPRMKLPPNHDTLNDDLPVPPDSDGIPIPNPPRTAYPLPPLPPLPRGADLFPSPTPAYHAHRSGSIMDCFKHTVLLHLHSELREAYGTSITYVGVGGGGAGVASDISDSILRQSGIDCVYEYGRWFARLARSTHHTVQHSFIPLMQAVRAVNGGSKLDRGFRYYPGNAAVIRHAMRAHDRAVFFENDTQLARQLVEYFDNQPQGKGESKQPPVIPPLRVDAAVEADKAEKSQWAMYNRVVVHPLNGFTSASNDSSGGQFNPVVSLGRPLTSHALFHFDLTKERYENVRHMQERLGTHILPQLFDQYPTATFVTSVPLYGDTLPFDVVRWHLRGHRDVMLVRFNGQQVHVLPEEKEMNGNRERDEYGEDDMYDEMEPDEEVDEDEEADEDENEDEEEADEQEAEDDADEVEETVGDGASASKRWEQGAADAVQGNYLPFNGPFNTSIPIDEPWGVAMIIVKPPRGFDAVCELVQEDMHDVQNHIPHVGLVDVDEERLMANEAAAGDVVQRSDEQREAIHQEVMGQMRNTFFEPEYVWLTPRHIDSIDYEQAWDWYNDRNVSITNNNSADSEFKRKEQVVIQTEGPSALPASRYGKRRTKHVDQLYSYYNEAKLIADMARPYRGAVGDASKKGKRKPAPTPVADKTAQPEHVDVKATGEIRRAAERVHENEAKLLEAWKREMQQRTPQQQEQQQQHGTPPSQ